MSDRLLDSGTYCAGVDAEQIAPGVWRAGTRYVNWFVVDDADGLVIVDAGLPGYRRHVDRVLNAIGRPRSSVRALLLTHGHVDHTGFADVVAADGASVYLHPDDDVVAHDPRRNRTQRPVSRYLHWPATSAFVVHAIRQGALGKSRMPKTTPLADGQVVDVPGQPRVHHAPGHTAGSVVFEFPEHGVAIVGDALCTVSAKSGRPVSPRLQSRGSNEDSDEALSSLDRLGDMDARLVLPGHGREWRDGIASAAESARRYGCY